MRETRPLLAWLVAVLLLTAACVDRGAPDREAASRQERPEIAWGQWRGPGGLGISTESPLPVRWSGDGGADGIRWKAALAGKGNSSPIAVGDRVFLTAAVKREGGLLDRDVLAFDLTDGTPLFRTTIFSDAEYRTHNQNTNAAPTPVADGTAVYVFFGSMLAAVDPEGAVLWRQRIDPLYEEYAHWGSASSPILFEDLILVFQDAEKAVADKEGWLGAFDKTTGNEVWRQRWKDTCCSYTTPLLWDRAGEVDLVVAHSGSVRAYDPRTGQSRWSHPYQVNQFVASPVATGDLLCTLGGAHNVKGNGCFRVSGRHPEAVVEQLWWDAHSAPEDASPVLYGETLFAVTIQGVMSAYDPLTGNVLWRTRLPTRAHHASLVAGDGKVYVLSSWGRVLVLDATSREFTLLADNDLGEKATNASPAIAGGCLLVRTRENLVCVGTQAADPSTSVVQPSG